MSINQSMITQFQALEKSMTEQLAAMRKTLGMGEITAAPAGKKVKKVKPVDDSASATSEPKAPSAWNTLVAQTVADMKQNGWTSWTDLKGAVWPASRAGTIKDKSGAEVAGFVYDGGALTDGKPPSPALGGMVRASFLKSQSDPAHAAKAAAYHEKLSEKRSAGGSVGSGEEAAPVADAPKKAGRRKMTEEEKAAAAVKRAEKKAAEKPAAGGAPASEAEEFEDVPATVTPVKVKKPIMAPKAPVKKVDLSFFAWEHNGKKYITNDRGDVIEPEEGTWVGRFNGKTIDESVTEPTDLEGVEMRE
jgi:hypothetical protein